MAVVGSAHSLGDEVSFGQNLINEKTGCVLSAFLAEKWQAQKFGRELVSSADLCYNGGSVNASLREGGGPR